MSDLEDTDGGSKAQQLQQLQQLRQLRQHVAQLQTENERLSAAQGSEAGGSGPLPVRREQALYLPRERRCSKFSGSRTDGTLSIEEWTEEAQSCIRSRYLSDLEKAMFLYDHLEGEARSEIKYRPVAVRENPTEMILVLKEVYGCSKSYVYWQQRFFDRKQKEAESLFEFSHALMDLMVKVKQSKLDSIANADMVLRDQFCENVRDPMLRRELKKLVRANVSSSLLDVRREATRWVEEGQTSRDRTHSAPGRRNEAPYISQCEAASAQPSEIAELKEMVLKQQAQLDMLVQHLGPAAGQSRAPQPYREGRFKRAPNGQPICIRCNQPGHIARYCQSAPPPSNLRPDPHTFPDSTASVPLAHVGKLEIPSVLSHTLGGDGVGSTCASFGQLVGKCPVLEVCMGGVMVPCLIDRPNQLLQLLQLAANGLDIPYTGYIELDIFVLGQRILGRGILIVRDPSGVTLQNRKAAAPGILGMNVLSECYRVLFEQHGAQLFHSPSVESAAPVARRALRHCEKIQAIFNASKPFKVKVQGKSPVCLGAGALTMVPVTCPQWDTAEFLLEPLSFEDGQLPEGLLVSPTLVSAKRGMLCAPVVNVGCTDVWLSPRCAIGTVQAALDGPDSLAPAEVEAMPGEATEALRRSARSTAGRHSNPYRLPQSVSTRDEEG
ncbi:hypothetical protein N1851_002542 [Merluccius polli]|uniref:CCHC-type domain-containing protein n=1 Tax=Merluccius polli TaxID=89951 RepID=A0AA47N9W6_MERPO|nr:hypothetical protein N1851_002542 [Merluccius polli]